MKIVKSWMYLLSLISTVFLVSCTETIVEEADPPAPPEQAYCRQNNVFSNPVTVETTAQFNIRQNDEATNGLGAEILKGPIRFAEVQVTDTSGNILQCGETDDAGFISLSVPKNKSLILRVNSRSDNDHVKVSVLNSPNTNQYYSLSKSFSSTTGAATITLPNMVASAVSGVLLGAAFNIHFNILRANESLRYFICNDPDPPGCADFDVAPKSVVYWAKGVEPYSSYFGGNAALSFYTLGEGHLYILGGVEGNITTEDTDHFDDSVIAHEYGHFIEDTYSQTDSPGGRHNGDSIIDPRLAWGEGWANFFSAAVRGEKFYKDTIGNPDGLPADFNYDMDRDSPVKDNPTALGEGNFRELAIARTLLDVIDPFKITPTSGFTGVNGTGADDHGTDSATSPFLNFWTVFATIFPSSSHHFRSVGLFLKNNTDVSAGYNATLIATKHRIVKDVDDYGLTLNTPGACTMTITPDDVTSSDDCDGICSKGSLIACCSNQFASNDFYYVNHTGAISTIRLDITSNIAGGATDLDLYLYREGYVFGLGAVKIAKGASGTTTKTINMSGVAAGHYMLNVNARPTSGADPNASNYELYVNGAQVCPQ